MANQKTTIPRKSRKIAPLAGVVIVSLFYLVAIFADFMAPYDYREQTRLEPSAPPSSIRWRDVKGQFHARPFIYAQKLVDARDMRYEEDTTQIFTLDLLVNGNSYSLFGIIPANTHLFGVNPQFTDNAPRIRLLGTDQLGRDRYSRLLYAIRFSLFVSPIGLLLACLIGWLFGAISGYASQTLDSVMMGIADTVISLPTLILILAARAAFPLVMPRTAAAILLIFIFAVTGWAEIARFTRGLVLEVKQRDFVVAARSTGLKESAILLRHILPNISSPLFVQATLMLPFFLLAEVALSFLGVGLQEPEPSLGNLLAAANDMATLGNSPIVTLVPAIMIFLFVLGIRLLTYRNSQKSSRHVI